MLPKQYLLAYLLYYKITSNYRMSSCNDNHAKVAWLSNQYHSMADGRDAVVVTAFFVNCTHRILCLQYNYKEPFPKNKTTEKKLCEGEDI